MCITLHKSLSDKIWMQLLKLKTKYAKLKVLHKKTRAKGKKSNIGHGTFNTE